MFGRCTDIRHVNFHKCIQTEWPFGIKQTFLPLELNQGVIYNVKAITTYCWFRTENVLSHPSSGKRIKCSFVLGIAPFNSQLCAKLVFCTK